MSALPADVELHIPSEWAMAFLRKRLITSEPIPEQELRTLAMIIDVAIVEKQMEQKIMGAD